MCVVRRNDRASIEPRFLSFVLRSTVSRALLVAMPSQPPQPDLYGGLIKMYTNQQPLKIWGHTNKMTSLHYLLIYTRTAYKTEILG